MGARNFVRLSAPSGWPWIRLWRSLAARVKTGPRELAIAVVLCAWLAPANAAPAEMGVADSSEAVLERAPEAIGAGVVEAVEQATNTLIIEGYRYRMASGLSVEQAGVMADVVELASGTRVQIRYLRHSEGLPEITAIRVVPDGYEIHRH